MIGKKLKELIKVRNLKQIKLAKYVGISPSRLSNYLSDKREPDLDMLAKMAKYLAVDLNYFTDVRFPTKKDIMYAVPAPDDSIVMESVELNEVDGMKEVISVPYLSINSKKRALKNKVMPVSRIFLEDIKDPEDNTILFEVTTGIGGENFKQGDFILAAKFISVNPSSGCLVFETGRNGKAYRYLEDNNVRILLSEDTKEIYNIPDESELSRYYVIVWVFSRP